MGAAVVVVAGAVTGVVLATGQDPPQPRKQCTTAPKALIVAGVKTVNAGAVEAAFKLPMKKAAFALEPVQQDWPNDPVVEYNYGIALFCAGYLGEAQQAFTAAKSDGRNTYYEMRADEILHPQYYVPTDGLYPVFQPTSHDALLDRGVLLQREGHQHSAEQLYEQAAKLHPDDAQAQVAAAVGRFDESDLSASFSRLGPLVKRFPKSQTVRYHLGLLLAWTGQRAEATKQFHAAYALGPRTGLGRQAKVFLDGLVAPGTSGSAK